LIATVVVVPLRAVANAQAAWRPERSTTATPADATWWMSGWTRSPH